MKFPLKFKVHDLTQNMRGQGKRMGKMVLGSMAGRTGKSTSIDMRETFGLNDEDAYELECMNMFEFSAYRKARESGLNHNEALVLAYK